MHDFQVGVIAMGEGRGRRESAELLDAVAEAAIPIGEQTRVLYIAIRYQIRDEDVDDIKWKISLVLLDDLISERKKKRKRGVRR